MKSTRSRLKETAFSLFAAYGYESTTMSQIANAIGIKKPTLYSYYESKEELFLSVFAEVAEEYRQYMEQILEEAQQMESTKDQLYHIFQRYITYFAQNHLKKWSVESIHPHEQLLADQWGILGTSRYSDLE
jgi:TetR/AcrR family transcriptional repressor of cmeABC operon